MLPTITPDSIALLALLDAQHAQSATALAKKLGINVQQIQVLLKEIETAGVELVRKSGKGYCLSQPLPWLDLDAWQQAAQARGAQLPKKEKHTEQRSILVPLAHGGVQSLSLTRVMSVDSTSSELLRHLPRTNIHAQALITEWQTTGRGRHGQPWYALPGGSLMFSLGWRFTCDSHFLSGLPMAISLAIAEALEKEGFVDIQLKWPNDIVFHFQKLGGVLVELNNETSGVTDAVIGIGLNLYFPRAAREPIARAVTDLYSIQHVMPDRNVLLAAIMMELANTLTVYAQKGFAAFASSWQKRHIYHQRAVRLLLPDQQIVKGIALGIDADGALILGEPSADKDKAARYTAGEISLYPA